jgi:hypothetical protein
VIANSAFLAGLVVFLLVAWVAGELSYLAPYKRALFHAHGWPLAAVALVLFFNLFGLCYAAARGLFLRETGRKLQHVDRQLGTDDTVLEDLRRRLRP